MLDIEWRAGIGYGDFVTGLGYAYTSSQKYNTPVSITFYWDHSEDYLFSTEDNETIVNRCRYIESIMQPNPLVEVHHKYDTRLLYRFKNQLDEFNPLHGLWYSTLKREPSNIVVVWTSRNNISFPGYDKDPAYDMWDGIIEVVRSFGYDVREITYRTPVAEAMDLIRKCKFGIGYDGLAHQLFKFMWKPLIVCCKRTQLNRLLVPQASLVSDPFKLLNESFLKERVKESILRVNITHKEHQQYIQTKQNYYEHRLFNTPIY